MLIAETDTANEEVLFTDTFLLLEPSLFVEPFMNFSFDKFYTKLIFLN